MTRRRSRVLKRRRVRKSRRRVRKSRRNRRFAVEQVRGLDRAQALGGFQALMSRIAKEGNSGMYCTSPRARLGRRPSLIHVKPRGCIIPVATGLHAPSSATGASAVSPASVPPYDDEEYELRKRRRARALEKLRRRLILEGLENITQGDCYTSDSESYYSDSSGSSTPTSIKC